MLLPEAKAPLAGRLLPVAVGQVAGRQSPRLPSKIPVPLRRGATRQTPEAVPLLIGATVFTAVAEETPYAVRACAALGPQVRVGLPGILWQGRPRLQIGAAGLIKVVAAAATKTTDGPVTVPAETAIPQIPLHGVAAPVELIDPRRRPCPPHDTDRDGRPAARLTEEARMAVEAAVDAAGVTGGLPTRLMQRLASVVALATGPAQEGVPVDVRGKPPPLRAVLEGELPIKVPVVETRQVSARTATSRVPPRQAKMEGEQMRKAAALPRAETAQAQAEPQKMGASVRPMVAGGRKAHAGRAPGCVASAVSAPPLR